MDFNGKQIGIVLTLAAVIGLFVMSFTIVAPNERGVRVHLGQVYDNVLKPGPYLMIPFVQEIRKYSIAPREVNASINNMAEAAITQDNQPVMFTAKAYWVFDESNIVEITRNFTIAQLERIIADNIRAGIKQTVGHYTIFDLAGNQLEISARAEDRIRKGLAQFPVEIRQVNILNWQWAPEFTARIQETMQQAQNVRRLEQELRQVEVNAQRQVVEAQAARTAAEEAALARKNVARLDAEAAIETARGINEANRLIAQNQHLFLRQRELQIDSIRASRWDGRNVPSYVPLTAAGGIVQLPLVQQK